jgi:hypothetical protein
MTALSSEFVFGFVDLLRWVRDRYEDAKDPAEKREWSIRELNILRRMAREIHPAVDREGLLAPLNDLVLSLFSLDYGVADPSLRPRKLKHRPPDPRWALFRGRAAAASELLIRNGATASEADSWVATRLRREGYQKPGKSADPRITVATIKGWRKAAREGRPDELIRAQFETVVEDCDPQVREYLPELSAVYEVLFQYGAEERLKNVAHSGMMRAVTVIELICAHFPPPESPEK